MRYSNEFSQGGMRAMPSPLAALQTIDPILTELALGQPQMGGFPGARILKRIIAPAMTFQFPRYGVERLRAYDTERSMRAPIKHAEFSVSMESGTLKRFSFSALWDQDEMSNADGWLNLASRSVEFARGIVELDIERRRRDLLTTVTNYPVANRLAIGAGSEWGTVGGNFKSNVDTVVAAIVAATGLQRSQLSMFLPYQSLVAAQADVVFNAARANYNVNPPTIEELRAYVDIGSIWTDNPVEADDQDVVAPMYGDVAIIYFDGQTTDFGAMNDWGTYTFGVDFTWNKGVASAPWYDPKHTSTHFPWTNYSNPALLTPAAGGIITNTAP